MPVYEYDCPHCGPFDELRSMAERDVAAACPECGDPAQRRITAPALGLMNGAVRMAHATNERSAHAPRRSRDGMTAPKPHGAGCSCCGGTRSRATQHNADGSKTFPSKRPWMISH